MRVFVHHIAIFMLVCALAVGCDQGVPQIQKTSVAYAQETVSPSGASSPPSTPVPALPTPTSPAPVSAPEPAQVAVKSVDAPPASSTPKNADPNLEQLVAQLKELAERKDSPTHQAVPATTAIGKEDVETLRTEVASLRKEVSRLQETVDAALAYLVGELGDENRKLKKDIALPADTTPESQPAAEDAVAPQEIPQPVATPPKRVDYGKLGYLSIKEWGRTPDEAKKLGGNVSSLRGMICAVSPGSTDDELKVVAKKLRETCVGFDNVNIDVFDDEASAHAFADRNTRDSQHYVMNIMRHKLTGKDATVLVRSNGTREIGVE